MERLTIRNSDGSVSQPTGTTVEEVFYRLAAYEDTGVEPNKVEDYKNNHIAYMAREGMFIARSDLERWIKMGKDRMNEVCKAEEEGRLVVLPCKVGGIVYGAETSPIIPMHVMEPAVYLESSEGGDFETLGNFGKTVFLTREEAEAALQSVTNRNGLERGGFQNGNSHDAVKNWPPYLDLPKRNESLVEKQATSDLYDEDGGDIYE